MILSLDNTLTDDSALIKIVAPIINQTQTEFGSHSFAVKVLTCDDCGAQLVNNECPDCSKPILL